MDDLKKVDAAIMEYDITRLATVELNQIADLSGRGMLPDEIAKHLGVSVGKVNYQLNRLIDLSKRAKLIRDANAVIKQRTRLERLLPRTIKPILSAIEGYKSENMGDRKLAADTALSVNKGLGVLRDHQEIDSNTRVDIFAELRNDAKLSIDMLRCFAVEQGSIKAQIADVPDDPD